MDQTGQASSNGPRTTGKGRARARAWISRYAWGRDYHEVLRAKLEQLRAAVEELAPGAETRVFVDTGPVIERAFARFSGLGWMGKNTCLINERKGSWFFLGVLLTSLELAPDFPAPDRCGSCTRCLEACPTGALLEPYVMDASRCIAYFTIELKGSSPGNFRPQIGANIFGCDICQDVCPWNNRPLSLVRGPSHGEGERVAPREEARHVTTTTQPEFQPLWIAKGCHSSTAPKRREDNRPQATDDRPRTTNDGQQTTDNGLRMGEPVSSFQFPISLVHPPLEALGEITEIDFRRLFAHSPIKRVKYRGWLRNLCVAMGNSGDGRFIPRLQALAQHPDPIIREHAAWASARLVRELMQSRGEGNNPTATRSFHGRIKKHRPGIRKRSDRDGIQDRK